MAKAAAVRTSHTFDRIATSLAGFVIVGLVIFLLIRNEPIASDQLFFALRVVLSFATAVLGATIPGFLDVSWNGAGLAIRAGGALALFALTFLYTPAMAENAGQTTITATNGVAAQRIERSTIQMGAPPPRP